MANKKSSGQVFTPHYLVSDMLNVAGYFGDKILKKHIIDNSCGNGAFLCEIVRRYIDAFLQTNSNLEQLKEELETFVHGIEIDPDAYQQCLSRLSQIASDVGLYNVSWNVMNADTLSVTLFDGKMDYVVGNPPYVRVHNLEGSYDAVKKFRFAELGMTDLFIVFFEMGFKMLSKDGVMCLITPSSWLSSKAGSNLRMYIRQHKNLSGLIDLEHFQPFEATTYTLISRFQKPLSFDKIEYNNYDGLNLTKRFQCFLSLEEICIGDGFYLANSEKLSELREIKTGYSCSYVSVKNGFATLADKVFIGDFDFGEGTIDILKASTGKWSKCIYPYDNQGKPLPLEELKKYKPAYQHLLSNADKLTKGRDIESDQYWYLFGRTQALKDVSKMKYAINTIVKDKGSIKLEKVPEGKGLYSGLYILTEIEFEEIGQLVRSEDFIDYIKSLKNYKSGGYYTFASKDLEQYLNYKLSEKYGQSRISDSCRKLF